MANALYPKWKEALLQNDATANLDGSGTTGVYVGIIDLADYTYNEADEFWDEAGAADPIDGIVGTLVELTSKTFVSGTFDAADTLVPSVTGDPAEAFILVVKNVSDAGASWRVVYYNDQAAAFPVTPDGNNINFTWDASGIFTL